MTKKFLCTIMLLVTLFASFTACSHVHNFGEWEISKLATCIEEGIKERYCSCGEKQTASICMADHKYVDGICGSCGHNINSENSENTQTKSDEEKYNEACSLLEVGNYSASYNIFKQIEDYKDSKIYLSRFHFGVISLTLGESNVSVMYNDKNLPVKYEISEGEYKVEHFFSYDAQGNLVEWVEFYSSGSQYNTKYEYDEKGNLIKELYTYPDGSSWTKEYEYDEKGNLIKETKTNLDGSSRTTEYEYDEKGNLIKELYTYSDGSSWTTEYEYDEKGNLIIETETDRYGSSQTTEYEYDEKGNLIRVIYPGVDTYYTYDNKGKLIVEYNGDYKFYNYDDKGNLIKDCCYSNGEIIIANYTYDEYDNLIQMVYTNYKGTTIEFEYKLVYIPYDIKQNVIDILNISNIGS